MAVCKHWTKTWGYENLISEDADDNGLITFIHSHVQLIYLERLFINYMICLQTLSKDSRLWESISEDADMIID